jgi:hypothetical protein
MAVALKCFKYAMKCMPSSYFTYQPSRESCGTGALDWVSGIAAELLSKEAPKLVGVVVVI